MVVVDSERHVKMPYRVSLLGGPMDGQDIEAEYLPEVIDGDSFHFFGQRAYVLIEIDYENKIAKYEHIKIGGKMEEGGFSEDSGI